MSTAEVRDPAPVPPGRSEEQPGTPSAASSARLPEEPGAGERQDGEEPGGARRTEEPAARSPSRGRPRLRRVLLPLLLVLLLAAGGGFLRLGAQLRGSADTADLALTDPAAAARVTGDVGTALSKVFSYRPTDTEATAGAAQELLDAPAAEQYGALMAELRQRVTEQKLTLTTRVVRTGVVRLTADRAQLLVFLDQVAQREGSAATVAPAQLSVSARLDGGHWRITDLKAR
ncbi:membrane protein [Kitasatospora herbaricolor]|uniref:hypothetical protein n=1 Tax=Kitasatospora herbaricolor TaxID=68217 RepID=UPI0019A7BE92|nr:hypothetical protein [Kitasatospora herbaricolor]MDQ0312127.1 Mce-associated membrane protein [Kitasatospora herbaricolor]GGU98450.1 membrane protein [Kitasatospora herbaricolor]